MTSQNPVISFTAPSISIQSTTGSKNITAQTFSLSSLSSFLSNIKSGGATVQLESLANNLGEIGKSVSNIQQFIKSTSSRDTNVLINEIGNITNQVKMIMPLETDMQINTGSTIMTNYQDTHPSGFQYHPNNYLQDSSLFTYMVQNKHKINLEKAMGASGSMIAAGRKFMQYADMLTNEETVVSFGSELLSSGAEGLGTIGTIASETLGLDAGIVGGTLGLDGILGTVGVGALEVGSVAMGGLAAVAALGVMAAGYGIYKGLGGEKSLTGIWSDAQNYFGGLFNP